MNAEGGGVMLAWLTFLMIAALFALEVPVLFLAAKNCWTVVSGWVKGLFTPKPKA